MVNQDDSFIREVNEELRSDQFKAIWKNYGKLLIAAAVLLVVGTGVKTAYDYWHELSASQSGDQFLSALKLIDEKKPDEAMAALTQLEKDGYGSYPVLAQMRAATLQAEKGDVKAAVAAFDAISKDSAIPQALRDTARLRSAWLQVDTGSYADILALVQDLAIPASGFRSSAREVLGLSAYKAGDMKQAKEWLDLIVNDAQAQRQSATRAQMMLDLIAASGKAS